MTPRVFVRNRGASSRRLAHPDSTSFLQSATMPLGKLPGVAGSTDDRALGHSGSGGPRWRSPDLLQLVLKAKLIEAAERQCGEDFDAPKADMHP